MTSKAPWWVAVVLLAAGCTDDGAAGDAGPEADASTDSTADGDAGGDLDAPAPDGEDDAGDEADSPAGACPAVPDPAEVVIRMQHLRMTAPAAMAGALFNGLMNDLLAAESFVWLTRFSGLGSGTLAVTTGSGHKVPERECTYAYLTLEYPAAETVMTESGLEFAMAGAPIPVANVALWARGTTWPDEPLTVLPLRELSIHGAFAPGRLAIGSCDEVEGTCVDDGVLESRVTVTDARATPIPSLGITLCGLISGDVGTPADMPDDCTGPRPWDDEPDTTVDGEEAWILTGTFAGSAVNVEP
ncbi:MAG: hypothetical protein HY907_22865 [Deltaproteobacteria bacterium]|nr:hypothetical protein [Deltaproteobacteria bacterium]